MPLDIYAPVIHGIGVRDHLEFAERSVGVIATHLDGGETGWIRRECPPDCHGFAPGHAHLDGSGERRLVVDPVRWDDEIHEPTRWRAAWWFLRAIFVLCAVHLLVNGQVLTQLPGFPAREFLAYLWRAIRAMAWILVLGVAALALALPLTLLVLVLPWAHRLAGDALGWTSDPVSRTRVIDAVTSRVAEVAADRTIVIGHSQGGAIAASAVRDLDPATTTLVTMGSGQALLAPIRASLRVGWGSIAALVGAIVVYVAAVLYLARTALVALGTALWGAGEALLHLVAAARAADPSVAATRRALAGDVAASALGALSPTFAVVTLALCVPVIAATVIVYARVFAPAIASVRDLCRPEVPGVDLCATFDPVSHPLTVLGSPRRIARITQSASLLDHVRYFANRVEVLTEIDRQISAIGVDRAPDPGSAGERRLVRHLVARLRVARGIATSALGLVAHLVAPGTWIAAACAAGAYAAGTVVKSRVWRGRQGVE
ncbi:MAG TPA: hypothetical protein VK015_06185 [Microbacterium sp.]|nr:hypothetical protein [Microbacterium sp.]